MHTRKNFNWKQNRIRICNTALTAYAHFKKCLENCASRRNGKLLWGYERVLRKDVELSELNVTSLRLGSMRLFRTECYARLLSLRRFERCYGIRLLAEASRKRTVRRRYILICLNSNAVCFQTFFAPPQSDVHSLAW